MKQPPRKLQERPNNGGKSSATNGTASLAAVFAAEAREAGLRYTSDAKPGIQRKRRGDAFTYRSPAGGRVTDADTLRRIKHLAIPPAWEEVWICPHENGHIQATGRDQRGRKQYRYHADWRQQRDENKFDRILAFAHALPGLRRRVKRDLALAGMPRDKAVATVVRLLEATLIRVGNDEYARHNRSYGLTTMHNRHVKIAGSRIEFSFRGKSGIQHQISVSDPQLARIVKRCQDMPGQEIFAYEDEDGAPHDIGSQDVNDYLRTVMKADFTAKDFRTWAGTVLAAMALQEMEAVTTKTEAKKNVIAAIEKVAGSLGNTPSVCRKCYIHPEIVESYLGGDTIATIQQRMVRKIDRSLAALKPEEAAVLMLLQQRLGEAKGKPSRAKAGRKS